MPKRISTDKKKIVKKKKNQKEIIKYTDDKLLENTMKLIEKKYEHNVCTQEMTDENESRGRSSSFSFPNSRKYYLPAFKKKDHIFQVTKPFIQKEKKKYNDWTFEEDLHLLKLCKTVKLRKKWRKISKMIGNNKTPRMCSYRFTKLNKLVYINKHNELVKRKVNIESKEIIGYDINEMLNIKEKKVLKKIKIINRKKDREKQIKISININNSPCIINNNNNRGLKNNDSNISMISDHFNHVDIEKTLTDLNQLQINDTQIKENHDLSYRQHFQPPFDITKSNLINQEISFKSSNNGFRYISDSDMKSILSFPSMNSGKKTTTFTRQPARLLSPLRGQDYIFKAKDFKNAYYSVFTEIRVSTEGDNSAKGIDSIDFSYKLPGDNKDDTSENHDQTFRLDTEERKEDSINRPKLNILNLTKIEDVISSRDIEETNDKLIKSIIDINCIKNEEMSETEYMLRMCCKSKQLENIITNSFQIKNK